MLSRYFLRYNLFPMQKSLRVSPAMATVVSDTLQDKELVVGLIDVRAPKPKRTTTHHKQQTSN